MHNPPATLDDDSLSLHDALPISLSVFGSAISRCIATEPSGSISSKSSSPFSSGSAVVPFASRSDRKSTRLNSSHVAISYAVFCLKKKNKHRTEQSSERRTAAYE